MKEMKLISMTELVLNAGKYLRQHTNTSRTIAFAENRLIKNYAQFLSQPLELGMFIPCVDGVPIEEPINNPHEQGTAAEYDAYIKRFKQFQQAKEKVLFEGFEEFKSHTNEFNTQVSFKHSSFICQFIIEGNSVEFLTKYNPTLTQTAIKKLGI